MTYDLIRGGWRFIDRGSVSFFYDRMQFDYENFRDLRGTAPVGGEPLYGFDADVVQVFFSVWFRRFALGAAACGEPLDPSVGARRARYQR